MGHTFSRQRRSKLPQTSSSIETASVDNFNTASKFEFVFPHYLDDAAKRQLILRALSSVHPSLIINFAKALEAYRFSILDRIEINGATTTKHLKSCGLLSECIGLLAIEKISLPEHICLLLVDKFSDSAKVRSFRFSGRFTSSTMTQVKIDDLTSPTPEFFFHIHSTYNASTVLDSDLLLASVNQLLRNETLTVAI